MLHALRRLFRPTYVDSTLAILTLAVAAFWLPAQSAQASGWVITFEDDFNEPSLDRSKWYTRYIYNNGTMDHFNDEKERFRENGNHVLQDGILNLIAMPPTANGYYPSGMIRSRQLFRYGYFESRIKMPAGRGLGPAFWLNSDYDENHN